MPKFGANSCIGCGEYGNSFTISRDHANERIICTKCLKKDKYFMGESKGGKYDFTALKFTSKDIYGFIENTDDDGVIRSVTIKGYEEFDEEDFVMLKKHGYEVCAVWRREYEDHIWIEVKAAKEWQADQRAKGMKLTYK